MKTGILGYKGRVNYHCSTPVNQWIDQLKDLPKNEFFTALAQRMDKEIHLGYTLYPCNYIALDRLNGNTEQGSHYTAADEQRFETYLKGQLAKIKLPDKDEAFLRQKMLEMYANPAINKGKVEGESE